MDGDSSKTPGAFSHLGDLVTEEQWQMMKPRKNG
jgi:hypothetical protein